MRLVEVDNQKLRGAMWGKHPEVAKALGVHVSTLSRKVNGKISLSLEELNKIAVVLRQDAMDFLKTVEVPEADFWQQVNQSYQALRDDPKAWAEEQKERELLEGTLADGLEPEVWTEDGKVLNA